MTGGAAGQVTLIICTLDRTRALDRCLRAVLGGTALPAAVTVVDQGRGEVDAALIAAFRDRGARFDHVRMRQRGVSRGRNLGVSRAATELVAFTDDDCVPDTHWLEALARSCREGIDGAAGRVLPLPAADPDLVPTSSRLSTVPVLYRGLTPHAPWDAGTGGNLLLRRRVFEQVGGFDETLGPGAPGRAAEDIDLLYRLLLDGCTLSYVPDAVVLHEMKTRRDYLWSQLGYGYGMGAFLGRHASAGDGAAVSLLRRYGRDRGGEVKRAVRQANGSALAGAALSLIGVAAGFGICRLREARARAVNGA